MVRRRVGAPDRVSYREIDDSNLAGVSGFIYHIAIRVDWERALAEAHRLLGTDAVTSAQAMVSGLLA